MNRALVPSQTVRALCGLALSALPALPAAAATPAAPAAYGEAFVAAFAEACVPQRLSYPGTKANAESLGWTLAQRQDHSELETMMARMDAGVAEAAKDFNATTDLEIYRKPVAGIDHYLVVARSSFVMEGFGENEAPDTWVYIGCYLYNFDATAPIDPSPVTALIGKPISHTVDEQGLVGHVWGPPCPMPRTGDTYMSYIADSSPVVAETGFSGLAIKFETSEPDPGEVVPETYC